MWSRFGFVFAGALLGYCSGCGAPPLSPREPTPGVFHFTIASYNVEQYDFDDSDTVRAVGGIDVDVLCLQETTPNWVEVLQERYGDDYEYQLYRPKDESSAGGFTMFSRFPIEEISYRPGPNNWHPAWHVRVDTPAGPFLVMNIHLRGILSGYDSDIDGFLNVDEDHRATIESFTENRADYPTLAIGDFNEDEEGPAIHYLEAQGFENVLPLFHPGQGTWHYPSIAGQFDKALDHILYDDAFFVPLNAYVLRKGDSDHIPVVAHFEVTQDFAPPAAAQN
jgi:endonuclease/exonuclease/phosphatase family metal-dependent hydrolase